MAMMAATIDHAQLGRWAVAARAGEQGATGHLYNWLHPRLYAVALSVLGNSEDARDAAQDAFLIGITRLNDLRDPMMVSAWFRRIVQHLCYRRSSRPHPVRLVPELHDAVLMTAADEMLVADDATLVHALERVPEKLRLALLLRYFTLDNDYDTLADRMGVPVGTVRSRLNDGKARLHAIWEAAHERIPPTPETDHWTEFYEETFRGMHFEAPVRTRLLGHIDPDVHMVLTSKREHRGRGYLESVLEDDLLHGSWFRPSRVTTSGNISVVDGENFNSVEHPDHCPPRSTMVLVRGGGHVLRVHLYNAPLPMEIA